MFGKAKCVSCHRGPHFSGSDFHNRGVPQSQTGLHVRTSDDGRFKDVPPLFGSAFNSNGAYSDAPHTGLLDELTNPMPDETKGRFRTPSLRNIELTPASLKIRPVPVTAIPVQLTGALAIDRFVAVNGQVVAVCSVQSLI
ncbi:MAG TPA: hypothetical protein VI072_30725 [Polyangiaceae bacterium]